MNVYGTNTELEGLKLGPCAAGDSCELTFAFRCELCAAGIHADGGLARSGWRVARLAGGRMAFAVADRRYTAGVANLRATVRLE